MKLHFNFKKASLMKNGHLFGFGNGPDADWRVIFSFMAVCIFAVLIIGLYIFVQVNRGALFTVERDKNEDTPRLNSALLSKTILYYETKASTFEKIKVSKEVVKDPSI